MNHSSAAKSKFNNQLLTATLNPTPALPVTRQTLNSVPERALKLLRGIGTSRGVRAALRQRGYKETDRQEGWRLLNLAGGTEKEPKVLVGQYDERVRAAILALDAWDEDGFAIIRATLERRFPEVAAKVLDGLSASTGIAAVLGVDKLLERLDTLAASRDKTDKAAIATLAERGITVAERKKLRAYVEIAQSGGTEDEDPTETEEEAAEAEAEHVQALLNLRAWYEEWATVAKAVVKRRDQLILLGVAKQRRSDGGDGETVPPAPPAVTATPTATSTTPAQAAAASN